MGIYEERLEEDLKVLRTKVQAAGSLAGTAVENAVNSILKWNRQLAYETILRDQEINRAVKSIDRLCHEFVIRHSPTAGHLRYVSSVLRVTVALERVGDYAVTICREMARLSAQPDSRVLADLEISVDPAREALRQSLKAFQEGNAELARGTKQMASHIGTTFDKAFDDLVQQGEEGATPIRDLLASLVVFNRLSRVCDQAKNICEETVFAAVGETKSPKRFRILFVDDSADCLGSMAAAIARKGFPDHAEYACAGCRSPSELPEDLAAFLEQRGHDLGSLKTVPIEKVPEIAGDYHILVVLGQRLTDRLGKPRYQTVILDWTADSALSGADSTPESRYAALSSRIADLMAILTGERPE